MAINDPRIIGLAVRCIRCKWLFRCPAAQPHRIRCYACTKPKPPPEPDASIMFNNS